MTGSGGNWCALVWPGQVWCGKDFFLRSVVILEARLAMMRHWWG